MIVMSRFSSSIVKVFNSDSLGVYLKALLFFGFMEIVLERGFLHMPQISDVLLPIVFSIKSFEVIIEGPILVTFVYILWKQKDSVASKILAGLIAIILITVISLYYLSLSKITTPVTLWMFFVLLTLSIISVSAVKRIWAVRNKGGFLSRFFLLVFLVLAVLTYAFAYGYNLSLNLASHFEIRLISEPVMLFAWAQNLLLANALLLFLYSIFAPCEGFSFNRKLLLKVLVLPSLLVFLLVVASVAMPSGSRFDMLQIVSLVLTMWGFAISKQQVFLYFAMLWLFLVAALLLREKGKMSNIYFQEFVAVFLMFFAGFLNIPPYMLMSVIAFILFSTSFVEKTIM